MSLISEIKIKINKKEHKLKFNCYALYRAQEDLELPDLNELFARIQKLDLKVLFTLLKRGINSDEDIEDLMKCDISLTELAEKISEALVKSLGVDKQDP